MRNQRGPAPQHALERMRVVITATAVSALGDGLLLVGLPLLASTLTRNEVLISGVFAASRVPWVLAPVIAAWTDRRGRPRRIMMRADVGRAAVLIVMLLLLWSGAGLWVVYPAAMVLSIGEIAFSSSASSYVRASVSDAQLDVVNGRLTAVTTGGEQMVGPPVGALVFSRIGHTLPILGDAASFLCSALILRRAPDPIVVAPVHRSIRETVREGFRVVRQSKAISYTTLWVTVVAFAQIMQASLLVVIGRDLGLSKAAYGLFIALIATGNVIGGLIAARVIARIGVFGATAAATVLGGVGHLAAGLDGTPAGVTFWLFVDAVAVMVGVTATIGQRQRLAPPELIGSVMTTTRMLTFGVAVPSAIVGGKLAGAYGVRTVLVVAGVIMLSVVAVGARTLRHAIAMGERQVMLRNRRYGR